VGTQNPSGGLKGGGISTFQLDFLTISVFFMFEKNIFQHIFKATNCAEDDFQGETLRG